MNYTKQLFITKDEDTAVFFERFDRVIINGQPWEIQAYNENYGTNSTNPNTGIIRVALKETYTSTNEQIKQYENEISAIEEQYIEPQSSLTDNGQIIGPSAIESFDVVKYSIVGLKDENTAAAAWEISQGAPVKILSQTEKELKLEIG